MKVRELESQFPYSKAMWTEYRNGGKLIPDSLLDSLVTELIPEPAMRERLLEKGRGLLAEAKDAAAQQERGEAAPVVRRPGSGAPAAEVFLRLDDARLQQIEAMRKLAASEKRCSQLEEMVSVLKTRCVELEGNLDRAREEIRAEVQRDLDLSVEYRRQADRQLEHARRANREAYELRLAAEEKVAREQLAVRQVVEQAADAGSAFVPQPSAHADHETTTPSMDQIADVLREAAEQLAEQDQDLDELREVMGLDRLGPSADEVVVVRGQVVDRGDVPVEREAVHEQRADNADNSVTRDDASARSSRGRAESSIAREVEMAANPVELGAQLQALRALAGAEKWSHVVDMAKTRLGFLGQGPTEVARVEEWLAGRRLPERWKDLAWLLVGLDATPQEVTAFRRAFHRLRTIHVSTSADISSAVLARRAAAAARPQPAAQRAIRPDPERGSDATDSVGARDRALGQPRSERMELPGALPLKAPTRPSIPSAPTRKPIVRWRDEALAITSLTLIVTIGVGYTAALGADPGPAMWKMAVFAVLALAAAALIGMAAIVLTFPPLKSGISDRPAVHVLIGGAPALLVGLALPPLLGRDLGGRWLADVVGLL
ncbi:hypothetical protein ACF09C_02665 [Streptomyces sp. NPDC014870]|uniref:hypothetical protein n=1 Tax=Streptomyces sp. NPDC014870 TaxID=3364925 RepID=UPI0036FEBC3A